MFEDLYLFTKGISSVNYNVPIPLQIFIYIFVAILITALVYLFKDVLDRSILRDQYMWIYIIIILNILNIIMVLGYYNRRTKTFIGDIGETGELGLRGGVGTNMNCSLCQTNIFMMSTTRYDNITRLTFSGLVERLITRDLPDRMETLNKMLNSSYFDFTEFSSNLLKGNFDMNNDTTQSLLLLSMYNEYPLVEYFNQSIGYSDNIATGYFKRPYGKVGYMSIGDTAFGGSEAYETASFMVNGDIRVPQGFETICSFITTKESGELDKYNIFRMIPPDFEEIRDDPDIPRDISRKPENDKYVSLGDIVYYNDPKEPNKAIDPLLFSCVKESCCKKIDTKDLKLMFIYPGASSKLSNVYALPNTGAQKKVSMTSSQNSNNDVSEGFFSVWKTSFNTIKVKFSNGDFTDNKTLLEILYTDNDGIIDEGLYTRDGRIKRKVIGKLESFLTKIKINKLIAVSVLFAHTLEDVKKELHRIYTLYIRGNNDINSTPTLNKLNNISNITFDVIAKSITDLQKVMDANIKAKLEKSEREIADVKTKRIRSLSNVKNPKQFKSESGAGYQLQKSYNNIRNQIMSLSVQIENSNNMMDITKIMFPQGLMGKIYNDDLTSVQTRILNILRVLVPPNVDVYMLKNECLVFEQVDEKRNILSMDLEDAINKFKDLREKINTDAEGYCGGKNVEMINFMIDKTYDIITDAIGHIPDYLNKLLRFNFEDITVDKMEIIANQLNKLNNYVFQKCNNN